MRIARVAEDGRAAGSGVEEKADGDRRRGKRKGQMVKFGGNLRAEFDWERVRLGEKGKKLQLRLDS